MTSAPSSELEWKGRPILLAEYRRHMSDRTPGGLDRVRTAELIGALSLATRDNSGDTSASAGTPGDGLHRERLPRTASRSQY
jgi:hypothetical protein